MYLSRSNCFHLIDFQFNSIPYFRKPYSLLEIGLSIFYYSICSFYRTSSNKISAYQICNVLSKKRMHKRTLPIRHLSVLHQFYHLGPVVQSIVSLTMSLRRQLLKYLLNTYANISLFFVGKMCESFALQKILTFF